MNTPDQPATLLTLHGVSKRFGIVQALVPIIEGAGGVITAWDGGDVQHGGTVLACGDRRLHAYLMNELRRVDGLPSTR